MISCKTIYLFTQLSVDTSLCFPGLLGLINNAGLNYVGDIECTPMAHYEKQAQVNLLGHIRVTKAFLPSIRNHMGKPQ